MTNQTKNGRPTLIEQSSKRWKKIRAGGILLVVAAVGACFVWADQYGPTDTGWTLASVLALAGLGVWGYGTARTWWDHG